VLDRLQRDDDLLKEEGRPVRTDIQKARDIVHKHGFRGLFDALDRGGVSLPAWLIPALLGHRNDDAG